jgi:hypothetical protein
MGVAAVLITSGSTLIRCSTAIPSAGLAAVGVIGGTPGPLPVVQEFSALQFSMATVAQPLL